MVGPIVYFCRRVPSVSLIVGTPGVSSKVGLLCIPDGCSPCVSLTVVPLVYP